MMFREKSTSKLYAFALAAVFALTLAGCGGGGGTAAVEEEPPAMPEPTAQEMCEADGGRYNADGSCTDAAGLAEEAALSGAQEAAMAAYMAARAAVYAAVDPVAAANAHKYAAMAGEANEAAQAATTSADAMTHQTAAETARDMAMEAGMERGLEITKLGNKIINQAAIDNAELEGKTGHDVPEPISNARRVGAAMATAAAMTPVNAAGNPHQGSNTTDPAENVATATATFTGAAPRIASTVGGEALDRGEMPLALQSRVFADDVRFAGTEMVLRDTDATPSTSTYAVVYTDINPATPDYTTADVDTNDNFLTVTELQGLIDHTTRTYPAIDADAIPSDGSSFAASLNFDVDNNVPAVKGRFFCGSTAACAISVNEDGMVTGVVGYVFQPAKSTAPADLKADTDYLAWGVWATVPDATGSEATVPAATVGAFGSGTMAFTVYPQLEGKATYNGVAHGLYAAGGMVEYFDADVSLEANFGGNVGADSGANPGTPDTNLLGSVTGSVTNIKAGGMDVEGSLSLMKANIVDADADGSQAGQFSAATEGVLGGNILSGTWAGEFFGPARAVTAKERETEFPSTAAGSFGGKSANNTVSILGSFGSWKAE